jgi:hypothetical protein
MVVPGDEDRAYELFTGAFAEWWPVTTHSVFGKSAATCVFEPRAGGRIFERHQDGRESLWGTVLEATEHSKLRFTWHPGRSASTAQEIRVSFEKMMFGTTLTLEHDNWDPAGAAAKDLRVSYERDWPKVLEAFVARVNKR